MKDANLISFSVPSGYTYDKTANSPFWEVLQVNTMRNQGSKYFSTLDDFSKVSEVWNFIL